MRRFFDTLYGALNKGARAVLQVYPENAQQVSQTLRQHPSVYAPDTQCQEYDIHCGVVVPWSYKTHCHHRLNC